LELGLWIESERLLHAKIDTIGVETQRKVVKEERSQRYDNQPYGSLF
jgi:predicted Zn-dependent peptidase